MLPRAIAPVLAAVSVAGVYFLLAAAPPPPPARSPPVLLCSFIDGNNATLTYTVNGVPGTKSITRQLF